MLRIQLCCWLLAVIARGAFADGLMIPSNPDYPKELLRNRLTEVEVEFNALVVETSVYQEFVNESDQPTDAVYSFPLPPDARATNFVYWHEGQAYQAVIEEREQALNPGTGEGGTAAEVNRYLAVSGIRIGLQGIPPREIQRVRLDYISTCQYLRGRCSYRYPLDTSEFITHPLDQLLFTINVRSNASITGFGSPTHPDFEVLRSTSRRLDLELSAPKAFPDQDLEFYYEIDNARLGVDFFSVADAGGDGHFALYVRPPNEVAPDQALPKRVFFLLSTAGSMLGVKLEQSVNAIERALDLLAERDEFNVVLFDSDVRTWRRSPSRATADAVAEAKAFLGRVNTSGGSRLDLGLKECLRQVDDEAFVNAILAFTDGRSPTNPMEIEGLNRFNTGIFPVGIGGDLDRARLELLAAENYGFVTYLDEGDNIAEGIVGVFSQISQPVLANTVIEYDRRDLDRVWPRKLPTTFAGSFFFTTGRYREPGLSEFAISGLSPAGVTVIDGELRFEDRTDVNLFAPLIWAKESIDALEREIAVFGEMAELRRQVVDLSMRYGLRSRYTAFVADYETAYVPPVEREEQEDQPLVAVVLDNPTAVAEEAGAAEGQGSALLRNYPNPFNASTVIRLYLGAEAQGRTKLLRFYNVLGQLVALIDISHLRPGAHEVRFDGRDLFGQPLGSGVYFVQLQVHNRVVGAIGVNLLR